MPGLHELLCESVSGTLASEQSRCAIQSSFQVYWYGTDLFVKQHLQGFNKTLTEFLVVWLNRWTKRRQIKIIVAIAILRSNEYRRTRWNNTEEPEKREKKTFFFSYWMFCLTLFIHIRCKRPLLGFQYYFFFIILFLFLGKKIIFCIFFVFFFFFCIVNQSVMILVGQAQY